jgi:hypothetical protein
MENCQTVMQFRFELADLPSSNLMSETPKYDLHGANVANFTHTVQGDQKAVQHNYATSQNLAESAQEIQQLLSQPAQTYPTNTEAEKENFLAQFDSEIKKNSRLRNILVTGEIELIKILCPPLGISIKMGRQWLKNAKLSQEI